MGEVIFNIAGMRLPLVLTDANRAISAPINIWNDHQDTISLRDAGWVLFAPADSHPFGNGLAILVRVAIIAAILVVPGIQGAVFGVVSLVLIPLTRRFAARITKPSPVASNMDALIGKTAQVKNEVSSTGGQIVVESAAQTAEKMREVMPNHNLGYWARGLFAIGLFDAGLLGALCISLATSWALGEVFGWAHSLNKTVRDAPWFYVAYVLMLLSAGVVSLISSVEVQNAITIFVQVVAVTLLPAALVFLILLLNDKPLMGEHVNTRWQNIANWSIALFVVIVSTVYGLSVLFPRILGSGS
jgi:hypothetical protein